MLRRQSSPARLPALVFLGVWFFELGLYGIQYALTIPLSPGSLLMGALADSATMAALWPIGYWIGGWRVTRKGVPYRLGVIALAAAVLIPLRVLFLQALLTPFGWFRRPFTISPALMLMYTPSNFMLFTLALSAAHVLRFREELHARALSAARLRSALSESRLRAMKAQLHPHFLFNALHGISALVYSDTEAARTVLARLQDLLDSVFARRDEQEVTLEEELRFSEQYLGIEQVRFRDRLKVNIDVPAELRRAVVPHLCLQPLVENAIRHGTSQKRGTHRLVIRASRTAKDLILVVSDDGRGLRPGWQEGLGIRSTRARLLDLYGERARLELKPRDDHGVEAVLVLPWNTEPTRSE